MSRQLQSVAKECGGSFHVGISVYHSVHADDMGFYLGSGHQRVLSFNFQARSD